MRKIIFRGKREDNNQWVKGWYSPFGCNAIYESHFIHTVDGEIFEVIPETVSQFTGLIDKNGKDIYEGDIVRLSEYKHPFEVRFFDGSFVLYDPIFDGNAFVLSEFKVRYLNLEIIGNLHDNPELLTNK